MGGSAHHGGPCAYPDDFGAWAPRTRSEQNSRHLRNASQRTQDTGAADPADVAGGQYALILGRMPGCRLRIGDHFEHEFLQSFLSRNLDELVQQTPAFPDMLACASV